MGSAVRGGLAGNHPSVTALMNGNLGVTTDFRTVWQSVVNEWLGGDSSRSCPGAPFAGLNRPDGQTTSLSEQAALARFGTSSPEGRCWAWAGTGAAFVAW